MDNIEAIQNPNEEMDRKKLIRLVELFVDHLLLHAWGEETFYYPEVANAAAAANAMADAAYMKLLDDEHHSIDAILRDVERMVKEPATRPDWRAKYDLFKKGLLSHMAKEENEFFPLSEKLLGPE